MEKVKNYLLEHVYFLLGMISLLAANIPNLYAAFTTGQTAAVGYIILIQLGLTFYLLDAIFRKRPSIFIVSGVLNTTLNLVVLIISLI